MTQHLEVVNEIIQVPLCWHLVKAVPHQEGQLVGQLAHLGDHHSTWPVVVEMAQLVSQALEVVWLQPRGVLDHVVAGGVHGALPHRLGHQEEVIP